MPTLDSQGSKRLLHWDGSAELRDPSKVFWRLEAAPPKSISAVNDRARGAVWLFDSPANLTEYRCEAQGILLDQDSRQPYYSWAEGENVDIRWSSKLSSTSSAEFGDYVIFQWKSYPNGTQNYPFLFKVDNNRVVMVHSDFKGAWLWIWSAPIAAGQWFDFRVVVKLSRDKDRGTLQLYFNGELQTFSNGETRYTGRTLDDHVNRPKWGVYNRDKPQHALKHWVHGLSLTHYR